MADERADERRFGPLSGCRARGAGGFSSSRRNRTVAQAAVPGDRRFRFLSPRPIRVMPGAAVRTFGNRWRAPASGSARPCVESE
jgi:hypothetical protein